MSCIMKTWYYCKSYLQTLKPLLFLCLAAQSNTTLCLFIIIFQSLVSLMYMALVSWSFSMPISVRLEFVFFASNYE